MHRRYTNHIYVSQWPVKCVIMKLNIAVLFLFYNFAVLSAIIKQNWHQFLPVVKADALKQQISNFIRKFNA